MWCTESYVRKSGVPMFREDRACNGPVEDGHRVIFRATARSIEGTRSVCRRYPKPPDMSQVRSPPAGFKSVVEPGCSEFMVTSDRRLGSYRSSLLSAGVAILGRRLAATSRIRNEGCRSRAGGSTRCCTRSIASATPGSFAAAVHTLSICQFTKRLSARRQPPPGDGDITESPSRFARQTGAICNRNWLRCAS
jgi:hypothetical protein